MLLSIRHLNIYFVFFAFHFMPLSADVFYKHIIVEKKGMSGKEVDGRGENELKHLRL